ncbi:DMT family transporter [Salinarimonas sp. NSM]|uniref:DMT family transporter n=1 Tax=Salinarimonas sp. NSM TaxID=3458003 RepID=UPI004036C60A
MGNLKGVAWATLGTGLFALIYVSGKLADGAAGAIQIMWLRYLGGFVTVAAVLAFTGRPASWLSTRQPALHAVRAACGAFGGVAAVYAAARMPVAEATAIGLLDGLLTVILGVVLLRERLRVGQVIGGVLCLIGALVAVTGEGALSGAVPVGPAAVALAGAALVACESILIKTLARAEKALTVLLYVNLYGSLILMVPALATWSPIALPMAGAFALLGPIAILAQTCNIFAFRRADAAVVGPVRYTWIVFGALYGSIFFAETPSPSTLAGAAAILVGGAVLAIARGAPVRDLPAR